MSVCVLKANEASHEMNRNGEEKPYNLQDYLEPDDFKRVADVRRSVWSGGFGGMMMGSLLGAGGYYFCKYRKLFGVNRKHFIPFVAGSAAIVGFVGSFAYGVTAMDHFDVPRIMKRHVDERKLAELTPYQKRQRELEELEDRKQMRRYDVRGQGSAHDDRRDGRRTWDEVREEYASRRRSR